MKLAYFSPLPPAKTGIAAYSRALVMALKPLCDVRVFTPTADFETLEDVEVVDFAANPHALKSLPEFDNVLYHIGNNPWYHEEIWRALSLFPGVVCLHDVVLYYLAAGLGKGGLLKELLLSDPENAVRDLQSIVAECPDGNLLRYPHPSRFACVRGIMESTPHIIVHNETSARALRVLGYFGRVDVIPLLHYESGPDFADEAIEDLRRELEYSESDFVIGAFGFIGPTKRLDKVLRALAYLQGTEAGRRVRMLVVGEGDSLEESIRELGLETVVTTAGFVPEERFAALLTAVDAIVNLRYPSHGESSASLIQAMVAGKPCMVTDDAWFAELPDDAVVKVSCGEAEIDEIVQAITRLAQSPEACRRLGANGRSHIVTHHSPAHVAARFLAALRAGGRAAQPARAAAEARGEAEFSPASYLAARARELTP